MLRTNTTLISLALCAWACGGAPPDTPEQGSTELRAPSKRQLKLDRMVTGEEFENYQIRHAGRVAHYDGLQTQHDLAHQVLFQLYRSEHLRELDEEEDAEEARYAARRNLIPTSVSGGASSAAPRPPRGFLPQARSARRHFYRTPYFKALEARRATAVADIATALSRPQVPRPERVQLLRLLHALVRDTTDAASLRAAKSTFLRYATADYSPREEDFTPHLAFAYYGRLETNATTRASSGARFVRAAHAPLPPHLARRMYSTHAYEEIRSATRLLGAP